MESMSALLNSFNRNSSKINMDKDINYERIRKKIELRQNDINNILFSERKIKEENIGNKNEKKEINIKMLKNLDMPTDFQINTFKYYESVIFL